MKEKSGMSSVSLIVGDKKIFSSGINISWHDLQVTTKNNRRQILKNVSGKCEAGSLTAILGASGSGKTTFLNFLTRNFTNLRYSGEVLVNGRNIGKRISKLCGYVRQDDVFLGELTVIEHLRFRLRLTCQGLSKFEREEKIEELLDRFDLTRQANLSIGIPGVKKTLSGGERKRLSLATEIITDPQILFCDEPTSGLDFATARRVVYTLQELSQSGMTVICTMHQPSSELFVTFTRIMLFAEGQMAFIGSPQNSISFFESIGRPVPTYYNPADHFLEVLDEAKNFNPCKPEHGLTLEKIVNSFKALPVKDHVIDTEKSIDYNLYKESQVAWLTQVCEVIWRQYTRMLRDPLAVRAKMIECVGIALFYGIMFYRLPIDSDVQNAFKYSWKNIIDINGALLISIVFLSVTFVVMVALRFMIIWPLVEREIADSVYSFSAFYIGECIVTQIFAIILPLCYALVTYCFFGLRMEWIPFINYCWILILCCSFCLSVGYLVSSFSPNVDFTIAILPAGIMPMVVTCGYLMSPEGIPWYVYPVRYVSWYAQLAELLQINQWGKLTVDQLCVPRPNATVLEYKYSMAFFGEQTRIIKDEEICRLRFPDGGESILKEMEFSVDHWWINIFALVSEMIILRFGAFLIYKDRLRKNGIKKPLVKSRLCQTT